MVTITWQEGDKAPETFTISDAVLDSLEQFLKSSQMNKGAGPIHSTVKDMLFTSMTEIIIKPALHVFPTPEIADLKTRAEAAQKALADAHAAIVKNALV